MNFCWGCGEVEHNSTYLPTSSPVVWPGMILSVPIHICASPSPAVSWPPSLLTPLQRRSNTSAFCRKMTSAPLLKLSKKFAALRGGEGSKTGKRNFIWSVFREMGLKPPWPLHDLNLVPKHCFSCCRIIGHKRL